MTNISKETTILDSSLITQYRSNHPSKNYTIKVIQCGDYIQVYKYFNSRLKNDTLYEKDIIKKIDTDNLTKKSKPLLHSIELKNIIRSKLQCQRIAKANIKEWSSFITLTFADNVKDIKEANKQFNIWRTNISKIKTDFKYLAVPEFQKRGAVHYHILSNISLEDTNIITKQKDNDNYYDVRFWTYGFSAFDDVRGDIKKIIGYLSKYMTKDVDERLYGHRRYLCSQNLIKPSLSYIDLDNENDLIYFTNLITNKNLDFTDKYFDTYTKSDIIYYEFLG